MNDFAPVLQPQQEKERHFRETGTPWKSSVTSAHSLHMRGLDGKPLASNAQPLTAPSIAFLSLPRSPSVLGMEGLCLPVQLLAVAYPSIFLGSGVRLVVCLGPREPSSSLLGQDSVYGSKICLQME